MLGLVGESGSGKSTIGRSLLRLVPVTSGSVNFDGVDVTRLQGGELKNMRRRMQMIFQDPYASLNPRMSVYDTLAEPLLLHAIENKKTVEQGVLKLMDDVGLARNFVRKYPHEFSGGQRQRIAIGRALATRPEFIVADEPVSALDVTIQAQILELMLELGQEYGLTMLFVSHDLAVVSEKGEIPEPSPLLNRASPGITLLPEITGLATPTPCGFITLAPTECSNPTTNVPVINGVVNLSNVNVFCTQTPAGKSPEEISASIVFSEVDITTSPLSFPFITLLQTFPDNIEVVVI